MSVRDLIDAIDSGNAIKIEDTFNAVMAEKISSRLESMRAAVSKNMFNEGACKVKEEKDEKDEEEMEDDSEDDSEDEGDEEDSEVEVKDGEEEKVKK